MKPTTQNQRRHEYAYQYGKESRQRDMTFDSCPFFAEDIRENWKRGWIDENQTIHERDGLKLTAPDPGWAAIESPQAWMEDV